MFCGSGCRVSCHCCVCQTISVNPTTGKRVPGGSKGRPKVKGSVEMALSRPDPSRHNGVKEEPFSDVEFCSKYPTLYAFLTDRTWDDGKPRVTSTLLIFLEHDVLRICINDRDSNRSAFITGQTIEEALTSLEARLCAETLEWRIKQAYGSAKVQTPF